MIQAVGLGLVAYLLFRKDKKPKVGDPDYMPPKALDPEGDDYRVVFIEQGEDGNGIYELESRTGVLYDDGSGEQTWVSAGYITGAEDVGYISAPSAVGGTITFEIEGMLYENVLVYSTLDKAREATTLPDESDPNQPAKPDEPEEEEPLPPVPVQPTLPDFGAGFGTGATWDSGWY